MIPGDPNRFERELQGDFSEVDAYLKRQRLISLTLAAALLVLVAALVLAGCITPTIWTDEQVKKAVRQDPREGRILVPCPKDEPKCLPRIL